MIRIPKPNYLLRSYWPTYRRAKKAAFDATKLKVVLRHYNLENWRLCRQLGGGNSLNLLLQTDRGKIVLKQYYWSLPSTLQEHSILDHLAETDFPTPKVELNREGQTYTELEDKHYAIYEFVEGYCYTDYLMPFGIRRQLVAAAGEMLARLHQLVVGFMPEGRKFNGFKPDGEQLWRDTAWHLEVVEQYLERQARQKKVDELDDFLRDIVDKIKHDLVEVGRHYEQPSPHLPRLVTHGDYSPKNVFFRQKKIAAVLDFGDACLNLRAADVARGLTSFAQTGRYGVDERLARIFLQAYQCRQPLYEEEIAIIPDLIRWRYLQNIVWSLRQSGASHKSPKKHLASVQEKWFGCRWMKVHGDKLCDSLLSTT